MISSRDRKDTQDNINFNPIKIEDEFGLLDSEQNEENKEIEDFIPRTSTILKATDFMIHVNNDENSTQNNSAYSLGDGDKLYQKLEGFIKILIKNWFKKKLKKPSSKLQTQLSRKIAKRFSQTNEELIFDFQTPSKEVVDPYNSFKISMVGKTTKSIIQII